MESPNPRFFLKEVVSSDNKDKFGSPAGTDRTDAGGCSLSQPASADDMGAPNTGGSTADGSVFTFNSVTDESSDEKKSEQSSSPTILEDRTIASSGTRQSPIDKKSCIKMTIQKEYTFVVRYDYQTLLMKMKEINEQEVAKKSNQSLDIETGKDGKQPKGSSACASAESSPSPCTIETSNIKERFSSRVFRNIFSIVTSPISERRTEKGSAYNQHNKKSKSTSSPSLTKQEGLSAKTGIKSSTGEVQCKNKEPVPEVDKVKEDNPAL